MELLNCFGFGPSFRGWISIFYNGAYMHVLVNDFLTNPVYLWRKVRRGDALFSMYKRGSGAKLNKGKTKAHRWLS